MLLFGLLCLHEVRFFHIYLRLRRWFNGKSVIIIISVRFGGMICMNLNSVLPNYICDQQYAVWVRISWYGSSWAIFCVYRKVITHCDICYLIKLTEYPVFSILIVENSFFYVMGKLLINDYRFCKSKLYTPMHISQHYGYLSRNMEITLS